MEKQLSFEELCPHVREVGYQRGDFWQIPRRIYDHQMLYSLSGTAHLTLEAERYTLHPGQLTIIPPDTPHENVSEAGFTNIHLNIGEATLAFKQPAIIRDDGNQTILHLFSDAYLLFRGDPDKRAALLSSYGNLIVRYMNVSHTAHPKNRVAEAIEQSILQNYANASFNLEELLRSMPYCYDYLCKLFRQETGMTPNKYLNSLRLQSAADMLCSVYRSNSITEVAHLCGFRDPLYFSRMFKKRYGVSPKEYYPQKLREEQNKHVDSDSQKIILQD